MPLSKASDRLLIMTKVLPLIPLRNVVIFPSVETSLFFGRPESAKSLLTAYDNYGRMVIITAQKDVNTEKPEFKDIYETGVLARIEHVLQTDGSMHSIVKGLSRVKITKFIQTNPYILAQYEDLSLIDEQALDIQQPAEALLLNLKKAFSLGRQFDLPAMMQLSTGVSSSDLADQVSFAVNAKVEDKQKLLETLAVSIRLRAVTELLAQEMKVADLERDIETKTQEKFNSNMKRNVLEERKHQIEEELKKLGDKPEAETEFSELETKIKKLKVSESIKKKLLKEHKRLTQMGPMAPESSYIRTYLEIVVDLPFGVYSKNGLSIIKSKNILDHDHYGLKEVKERILEYLSVMKLKEKSKDTTQTANILCLIGPPGVGKTSVGKSIASAMGRKFARASLGGIRDEAEIRGHRRTYVGAMVGRIVSGLKDAGTMNPVFMLDEVDKIGADYRGDPSAALLEALDPEQNKDFTDHYLDFPLDLSKVFFILTGNDLGSIPIALRDRLEIINFYGYTQEEKYHIANNYLVKKEILANGLKNNQIVSFSTPTLNYLIDKYTREAGVRHLQRTIATLLRKVAKKIVTSKTKKVDVNDNTFIKKSLGPEKFTSQLKGKKDEIGVSTGLAWTSVGGDILFIEVNIMPGKGSLILTGKLGSVMKESCQAALSFVRSQASKWGIKQDFHKIDIHIHVPEGATPKDGPSAGGAITTALVSALKNQPILRDIAMTGEITLRGNILEIGGLKEKTIAAHRAGIKTIFYPFDNIKSLVDVPNEVKKTIKFIPVSHYSEIYKKIFS